MSDPANKPENQPIRRLPPRAQAQLLAPLYGKLLETETLELAYTALSDDPEAFSLEAMTPYTSDAVADAVLERLRNDLRARTYHPAAISRDSAKESAYSALLRDRIVQVAVKMVLEEAYPADLSCGPENEATVRWLAEAAAKGLTRVYSETIEEQSPADVACPRLFEAAISQVGDPDMASLLQMLVHEPGPVGDACRCLLAPVLTNIALQGIDQLIGQVRTLGRRDGFLHATATRFESSVIFLADHEMDYDWLLPAARERVREELARLELTADPAQTQRVDLERREKLRILDYELRYSTDRHGKARVDLKKLKESRRRPAKAQRQASDKRRHLFGLDFIQRCWRRSGIGQVLESVQAPFRLLSSIEVGWRHLPILLYPVLAIMFGWKSPAALLCAASFLVFSWRSIPTLARLAWLRRRRVSLIVVVLASAVGLYFLTSHLLASRSEIPAPGLPDGFYIGHLKKNTGGSERLVTYGLFVPPHFNKIAGPYPLIVFLHGYQERNERALFQIGMPRSIANQFGPTAPNGQFEFVAFFPLITKGSWDPANPEVQDAMLALDEVIKRHEIDPARIYLTGHSMGATGVWQLADRYPDKFAALAPVSSMFMPDVQKVRHIPTWIYCWAQGPPSTVERERRLVKELKDAHANVRYTELQKESWHGTWQEVCDSRELYDWFATKKKPD